MASPLELAPPQPAQPGQPGPPPQPSLQGLAGGPANGSPQGDQSLQIVTQHLMNSQQELEAAIRIKPELSTVLENWLNNIKPQIGQILFGGGGAPGQPGASPIPAISSMLATGAGTLNSRP